MAKTMVVGDCALAWSPPLSLSLSLSLYAVDRSLSVSLPLTRISPWIFGDLKFK